MSDTIQRTGPLKLVSPKGTLLGTFTLSPHLRDELARITRSDRHAPFKFVFSPPSDVRAGYDPKQNNLVLKRGILVRSYRWQFPDAFELYGITIEKFEMIPGFTFAPSAAYIRSLLD